LTQLAAAHRCAGQSGHRKTYAPVSGGEDRERRLLCQMVKILSPLSIFEIIILTS
jgi:hypothetical protein